MRKARNISFALTLMAGCVVIGVGGENPPNDPNEEKPALLVSCQPAQVDSA